MTIQDILNSNLSDKHKLEVITYLQKGGNARKEQTVTPTETITIGDKEYDVEVADNPKSRSIGLENCSYLRNDEGMLFIFDEPTTSSFTMRNCPIDLDIIFIDDDGEVLEVHSVQAYDSKPVVCKRPFQFVLEVNINSGINVGDELGQDSEEFNDDEQEEISKNKMLVLDSEGNVQMRLHGGERIFSRIFTRKMIKAAIKAYKSDLDSDYLRVGKIVIKELDAQDNREPEYTQLEN